MHAQHESLNKQLEAFRGGLLARLPWPERQGILRAAEDLRASTAARRHPEPGETAPDFALPDQHGRIVRLRDVLASGPAVLLFVRGGWCPFCSLTLRAYQDALPAMTAAGGRLFAITPQPGTSSCRTAERDLLGFPILTDRKNRVSDQYGVAYELAPALRDVYRRLGHDLPVLNGTGDWRVPLPATFVLDGKGQVVTAHVEPVVHRRLEPSRVVEVLSTLHVHA